MPRPRASPRPSQPRTRAQCQGRPTTRDFARRSRARATRKRLVVEPGADELGGGRKELLPRGGDVAVPGGQVVFDLFLKIGFDAFHLSRAHGVRLPGGRGERFLGLRRWSLSRGRTRWRRIARERKNRARCRAWRRHERLARGPRDRRHAGRKSVNRGRFDPFTTSRRMTGFARRRRQGRRLAHIADRGRGRLGLGTSARMFCTTQRLW